MSLLIIASCKNEKDNVEFKQGFPNEIHFRWQNAIYAPIKGGEFYKNIYVVFKSKDDFPEHAALTCVFSSGGFNIISIGFESCDENQYKSQKILTTELEDEPELLNLILNSKDTTLSYYWRKQYKS